MELDLFSKPLDPLEYHDMFGHQIELNQELLVSKYDDYYEKTNKYWDYLSMYYLYI